MKYILLNNAKNHSFTGSDFFNIGQLFLFSVFYHDPA